MPTLIAPAENYYLAGGELWFKRRGATTFVLIGGARKVAYTASVEHAESLDHSGKTLSLARRVPKKYSATLKFETDNWSYDNLMLFLMADTPIARAVTIPEYSGTSSRNANVFEIGQNLLIEGAFRFVSDNESGHPIALDVYNVAVKVGGDLALQVEDFTPIQIEGTVMRSSTGQYATMYVFDENLTVDNV